MNGCRSTRLLHGIPAKPSRRFILLKDPKFTARSSTHLPLSPSTANSKQQTLFVSSLSTSTLLFGYHSIWIAAITHDRSHRYPPEESELYGYHLLVQIHHLAWDLDHEGPSSNYWTRLHNETLTISFAHAPPVVAVLSPERLTPTSNASRRHFKYL